MASLSPPKLDATLFYPQIATEKNFVLGLSNLSLDDPSMNPFNDGKDTQMFGPGPVTTNTSNKKAARQPSCSVVFDNSIPVAAKKPVHLHHPSAASAIHATRNMTLWLQQNRPDVLAQMAQQGHHQVSSTITPNLAPAVPGIPANFVAPPAPM
jgi:hypothetical protein